jgi:hypothetical protein
MPAGIFIPSIDQNVEMAVIVFVIFWVPEFIDTIVQLIKHPHNHDLVWVNGWECGLLSLCIVLMCLFCGCCIESNSQGGYYVKCTVLVCLVVAAALSVTSTFISNGVRA